MNELKISRKEFIKKLALVNQMNPDGNFLLSGDKENSILEMVTYTKAEIFKTKLSNEEFFEFSDDFSILIPVKKLLSFFKLFESDEIKISIEKQKILMIEGKSKHSISLVSSDTFPQVHEELEFSELIFINKHQLKMCLDFTNLSISKLDSAQFTLRAFNLQISSDEAQFSSCDGTQASLCKIKSSFELTNDEKINVTFGLESLKKIGQFISDSSAQIEISFSKTYIKFSYDENELFINQSTVNFPDVTKLFFDEPNKSEFIIDAEKLTRAIQLVKLAETAVKSRLNFRLKDDEMRVELKTSDGEGSESIPIAFSGKPERLFSLNDKNLIEYLSKYQDKEILFRILDNQRLPVGIFFNQDNLEFSLSMFLSIVES